MSVQESAVVSDPHELVPAELFDRLAGRVVHDELVTPDMANRLMRQTLAFLYACAKNPDAGLAPSRTVDVGWHTFILHTREYAEFCERVAGRFIHHKPEDGALEVHRPAVATTLAAMRELGLTVDDELWPVAGDCSQCHAGCHDSPRSPLPRTPWDSLPVELREAVEAHTGPVVEEEPSRYGINSQITSTLHTVEGTVFVKGAQDERGRKALRNEAAVNPHVSKLAPRLLFEAEAGGWHLLGFEHLQGRHIDYSPGSADLAKLAELVGLLQETPRPQSTLLPFERRWSNLDGNLALLSGDAFLHTDFNSSNLLVTEDRAYLLDWAWSCKGAAWIDPAFLVVRLIANGHAPDQAETWASQFRSWLEASPEAVNTFVTLNARLWDQAMKREARESWAAITAASKRWADYRAL